jgi:large subunit ribosomal protein L13e
LFYQGDDLTASTTRQNLTVVDVYTPEAPRKITQEERDFKAYRTLREARSNARYDGVRKIRAAKKEEEEANKKK